MKSVVFASRNGKELLRDPISYIFCLGMPLVMLLVMTVVNTSIPAEAALNIFNIDRLSSGIAVFALTFVMLFTSLQVSKDRSSSFLLRLFASPMRAVDFLLGYTLPMFVVSLGQFVITFAVSAGIGGLIGAPLQLERIPLAIAVLRPSVVLFVGLGLLFGSLLNDKAAPPLSSIVITLTAMMGGIFMDIDSLGGTIKEVCAALPFYHAVRVSRAAMLGDYGQILPSLAIVGVYAAGIYAAAVLVFRRKMRSDVQ